MAREISRRQEGNVWRTEVADVSGGDSVPGVWKTYGVDSSNQPIGGITLGNGAMQGRWWTPAAVTPSEATDPFLCIIEAYFQMGSTSSVNGVFSFRRPTLVDGLAFNIEAVFQTQIGVAYADMSGNWMGLAFGGGIGSPDGTDWDASTPEVWTNGNMLRVNAVFLARFSGD